MDAAVVIHSIACAHVLGIPEVLERIFGFCSRAQNTCNARVRRSWRYLALSHVWKNIDSIKPFFQMLAPFKRKVKNDTLTVVRAINISSPILLFNHCTFSSSLATYIRLAGTKSKSTLALLWSWRCRRRTWTGVDSLAACTTVSSGKWQEVVPHSQSFQT